MPWQELTHSMSPDGTLRAKRFPSQAHVCLHPSAQDSSEAFGEGVGRRREDLLVLSMCQSHKETLSSRLWKIGLDDTVIGIFS